MYPSSTSRVSGRKIVIFLLWILFLAANVLATSLFPVAAAPFKPADDGAIIAKLPVSGDHTLKKLRARWRKNPDNENVALALAGYYLRLERSDGDPRYLGYAQAVLAPWWAKKTTRAPIALVRAQIFARRHDFDGALTHLDRILQTRPNYPQALLSRAFILQSLGRISEALGACQRLQSVAKSLASDTCLARMESLGGRIASADRRLTRALNSSAHESPRVRLWAMTNLAEIAWRRGKLDRAEQVYRQALSLNRRDAYLLDAFADFLLDRKRPDEVVRLLEKEPRADGHLLRLALARDALDEKKASSLIETLASRFAGNRLRSEALHLREQARFELSLRRRPAKALELALKNWRTQREPADARLVLKSALAADQLAKSRQVLDWLDRTGLEDPTLRTLADEIRNSHR